MEYLLMDKKIKKRNIVTALVLVFFVALFFSYTVYKLGTI